MSTTGKVRRTQLKFNAEFPELDSAVDLKVHTKCPEKYVMVDTETGQVYRGSGDKEGLDWGLLGKSWCKSELASLTVAEAALCIALQATVTARQKDE